VHTVGRWALRVPDGSDGPPNVPLWMDRLAVDLTDVAKDNQGTLAARPPSTALSPGVSGRYFATTDELDAGAARRRVYRDFGLGWDEFATLPVSRRMLDAGLAAELPSGLLTPAAFLALPAQPDGTVVRVQLVAPTTTVRGVNVRLRLNGGSGSPYRWEFDGGGWLFSKVAPTETTPAAAGVWADCTTPGPDVIASLAGDYEAMYGNRQLANNGASQSGLALGVGAVPTGTLLYSYTAAVSNMYETARAYDQFLAVPAGTTIRMRYMEAAGGGSWGERSVQLRPLRVAGPAAL
jgi:hypothetical protein